MAQHRLYSNALIITIAEQGAELHSLRTAEGTELLWQADPNIWPRHAPHLFPIVGRLANDTLIHRGRGYPVSQHGFARDLPFETVLCETSRCRLRLYDTPETRVHYPFSFEFDVSYALNEAQLEVRYTVRNPGGEDLPVSIGGHPAFVWPLPGNSSKTQHAIQFEADEPAAVRRLGGGLLLAETFPTPVRGHELQLNDDLFTADALIFDQLRSRRLTYTAPGAARLTLHFADFPHLGIWSKPGAGFICLEPWQGYASPQGFDGEFSTKPGVVLIAPGEERIWRYSIEVQM